MPSFFYFLINIFPNSTIGIIIRLVKIIKDHWKRDNVVRENNAARAGTK